MPCNKMYAPSEMRDLIKLIRLSDHMTSEEIETIRTQLVNIQWLKNIPGGFTTNTPQRFVNAFGNGTAYKKNEKNDIVSYGTPVPYGYWTGAVNQNDTTIVTPTEDMPYFLKELGIRCRQWAAKEYNIQERGNMFNVAVCNKYSHCDNEICAHTDDNKWYISDLNSGPMFASLTLYTKQPTSLENLANFQICIDNKWEDYKLPDATILLMPASIPHRVSKSKASTFCERINRFMI